MDYPINTMYLATWLATIQPANQLAISQSPKNFYFGHILALSGQILMVYKVNNGLFNLYSLSSYLSSHQLVSRKCCHQLRYLLAISQRCKSNFGGMKSKAGLWFTQLIQSNYLPNPIYQTQYTKPNLPNQIYKTESTKLNNPRKVFKI